MDGTERPPSPPALCRLNLSRRPKTRLALRHQIGPQLVNVTTAAKTAYQRRCDVRVELEHIVWRADDLPPLDQARGSETFRYKWVRDRCMSLRPRNAPRCIACPFLPGYESIPQSAAARCLRHQHPAPTSVAIPAMTSVEGSGTLAGVKSTNSSGLNAGLASSRV